MWTKDQMPVPPPTMGSWLAEQLDLDLAAGWVEGDRGAGAVEPAVAQHDAVAPGCARDRRLQVTDRRQPLAERRRGVVVERVVLPLDRATGAGVRHGGVALGDESLDARRLARRQQVVGALGAPGW